MFQASSKEKARGLWSERFATANAKGKLKVCAEASFQKFTTTFPIFNQIDARDCGDIMTYASEPPLDGRLGYSLLASVC